MKKNNPDDIVMCVKFSRRTFLTFSYSYKTSFYYNAKRYNGNFKINTHLPKYNFLAILI